MTHQGKPKPNLWLDAQLADQGRANGEAFDAELVDQSQLDRRNDSRNGAKDEEWNEAAVDKPGAHRHEQADQCTPRTGYEEPPVARFSWDRRQLRLEHRASDLRCGLHCHSCGPIVGTDGDQWSTVARHRQPR